MSYCTNVTKNERIFIQPSELCSFVALDYLKQKIDNELYVYDEKTIFTNKFITCNIDINNNFRDSDNTYSYKYDKNKKDLCYQLNNNDWNVNCSIRHMSPLYTYDKQTNSCTLIPNITYPDGFKINKEKGQSYIYYDTDKNDNPDYPLYRSQKRKAYCENKWFDWIIVPNYHLGNQYEKDSGAYSKRDVRKCYAPCGKGMFPYLTAENNKICIPKANAYDGIYAKKLDYSPISLINLIGNTSNTLNDLFYLMIIDKINNFNSNELQINTDLINKIDINYELNENCIPSINNTLFTNIINSETINLPNFEDYPDIITYKNPYFNEDEEELFTLRGMAINNMMNDVILLHTYLLAKNYHNFITTFINTKTNYIDSNNKKNDNSYTYLTIIEQDFNIYKNFKEKFNIINKNENGLYNNLINNYKTDIDNNNLHKYYQRFANILYKAINVCYNNETNFSKNLIIYTQNAFNNIKNKLNNEYINSYLLTNLYKNDKLILPTDLRLEIPFIDIPTVDRSPIKNYISANIIQDDKSPINIDIIYQQFYNLEKNNQKIFFFTQEDIEKKTKCINGEIPNPDVNIKGCLNCADICKDNESCLNNKNCSIYCENEYNKYVTANINLGNERNNKCGNIKTSNKEKSNINNKKIFDTPIDESANLPDFKYLLNVGIKIIFILLSLYMCYIFYQIYGETVLTLFNFIIYYIGYFATAIWFWFSYPIKWISNREWNSNEFTKIMRDYELANASAKYQRVVNKVNNLFSEMKQQSEQKS